MLRSLKLTSNVTINIKLGLGKCKFLIVTNWHEFAEIFQTTYMISI